MPFLYSVFSGSGHFRYWMVVSIVAIGVLIGLEIPLLARILRRAGSLRTILANVLTLDYLGGADSRAPISRTCCCPPWEPCTLPSPSVW